MEHAKGWGASAAIKSDVSGAQVLNVRRVQFSGNEVYVYILNTSPALSLGSVVAELDFML